MGMLSLAGIVSGAGAGAGKSLRQAQTYLNWEMLQEERGKLELARDERINERHIAQLQEARTFAASEEERLDKKRYDPKTLQNEADRQAAINKATHVQWKADKPFRKEQADEALQAALDGVEGQGAIDLAKIQGPMAKKIQAAARARTTEMQTQALEDIGSRAAWLTDPKNKQVLDNLRAVAKASYTELDQFAVDKATWEKDHRDQIYARDISDKNITHLQAAAVGIEREIGHIEKTLTGATDPGQIQSLSKRLRYLEREDSLVMARIMKAAGVKIETFDMPVPAQDAGTKKTDGTRSTVSKHVGAAFDRRAKAVGEVADPVLDKAMEIVRRSGMFNLIPITGMVMDVPAATDE